MKWQLMIIFLIECITFSTADENQTSNIGVIIDRICARRATAATETRTDREKGEKTEIIGREDNFASLSNSDNNIVDDTSDANSVEENTDSNTIINLNRNTNRRMNYGVTRSFFSDDSESSEEDNNFDNNVKMNFNISGKGHDKRQLPPGPNDYEEFDPET